MFSERFGTGLKKNQLPIALILGLLVSFIPLFYRLDAHPIFLWDESRQAINMAEMLQNGNAFITYFDGSPDHYNTKPPLLIWLQVLFMFITDNPELSLRTPSALAGLATVFAIIWLFHSFLSKPFWGVFASFILVSTSGFIELHGTRTGDYDALITIWITLAALQYFLYIERQSNKHLYLFYLFFGLGIGTKASVPLMILPLLFAWTLYSKKMISTLSNAAFWKGLLIPLMFVLLFYGIRSYLDPGYLKSAWHNDFGRFGSTIDGHHQPALYYIEKLILERGKFFFICLPLCLIVLISPNKPLKKLVLFSFFFVIIFLSVLSSAQTKIYWYDTPIYPFIAIALTGFILFLCQSLQSKKMKWTPILISGLIILITLFPYHHNIVKVIKNENYAWEGDEFYEPSTLLKKAILNQKNLESHFLLSDGDYFPHFKFYIDRLEQKRGYRVMHRRYLSDMRAGEKTIYFQPHTYQDSLDRHYSYKVSHRYSEYLKIIEIIP